jgi:transcriptional regulator with XRE-family HTH domain
MRLCQEEPCVVPSKRGTEGEVFGAHLRALRTARLLTQQQLADRCESNEPFISNLERGVKIPSLSMLLRLADALQCTMCEIVEIFDGPGAPNRHSRSR